VRWIIFFRGKPIAVVGGGDSAMEERRIFFRVCDESVFDSPPDGIRAVENHDRPRGRPIPKIEFVTPAAVETIHAPEVCDGITVVIQGRRKKRNSLTGFFVAVGTSEYDGI